MVILTASVILKLFINGDEISRTNKRPYHMIGTLFYQKQHTMHVNVPGVQSKSDVLKVVPFSVYTQLPSLSRSSAPSHTRVRNPSCAVTIAAKRLIYTLIGTLILYTPQVFLKYVPIFKRAYRKIKRRTLYAFAVIILTYKYEMITYFIANIGQHAS